MKQNKYDDVNFLSAYEKMPRSVKGLEGAGEWYVLKELLPELRNKSVLDLGCGVGWHCRYAREQQARSVIGVDISEKMLQKAREMTMILLFRTLECQLKTLIFQTLNLMLSSVHWLYTILIPSKQYVIKYLIF